MYGYVLAVVNFYLYVAYIVSESFMRCAIAWLYEE